MKQKKNIFFGRTFCFILLFLLVGCDNSKTAPDPPHAKAALVIELFSALKDKDYSLAGKKLQRLKIIDPDKVFLESIKNRLQNNQLIYKAQQLLDSGKIDEAIESLNKDISEQGENVALISALNQLKTLKNIKQLTTKALSTKTSREIAINSAKLNKAIASYPSAKDLTVFSKGRLNYARNLLAIEKALALEDLRADIDTGWVKGVSYLSTMVASLEVESPNNPDVLNYKEAMQKNWMDKDVSEVYYSPNKEFIFFRKGLLLNDTAKRDKIHKVLLSLPPNNFRSLLMKAVVLKFAGHKKEASAIIKQVADSLGISASKAKQWTLLRPDSLIGLKKINPFVLYPFFIYYEGYLKNNKNINQQN